MDSDADTDTAREPAPLEVMLEVVTADLVSLRRHQDLLRTLMSRPVGTWQGLLTLDPQAILAAHCQRYVHSREDTVLLETALEGLQATWTLCPDEEQPETHPFCLLLFYYGRDDLMWNSLALFNRQSLEKDFWP